MKLWQRRVVWRGETATVLGLGYFGVARGVPGAANTLMFAIGAIASVAILQVLLVTAPRKSPRTMPLWICGTIDVLFVGFLAWHGWFWCAAAWSCSCVCMAIVRQREDGASEMTDRGTEHGVRVPGTIRLTTYDDRQPSPPAGGAHQAA